MNKMEPQTLFFILLNLNLATAHYFTNLEWPYVKNPFPYSTFAPVSIDSRNIRPINVSPLKIIVEKRDKLLLQNTGDSIEVTLNQAKTLSSMTGGVLYNTTYYYHGVRFLWNGYYGDRCCNTIDGKGTALQAEITYINEKYKNFEIAKNFRDGITIIDTPVIVEGHTDNHLFPPFQKAMRHLIYPGSKFPIEGGSDVLAWMNVSENVTSYYAYPGSYGTTKNHFKIYQCTTTILIPLSQVPTISINQFIKTFLSVKSSYGGPLAFAVANFDAKPRPVVSAEGFHVSQI